MEGSLFWWQVGDIGLNIFHSLFIFFIVFGWILDKTRRAHLIALCLVLVSWVGLGYWYGWGYCMLTDWHWAIKRHLGESDLPSSFIGYFSSRVCGVTLSESAVGILAYGLLLLSIFMSVTLNFRDQRRKAKRLDFCCPH